MNITQEQIVGVILAGGLSRRMEGGEKSLIELDGQTLIKRVISRLSEQVETVVINANGDPDKFSSHNLPVFKDTIDGFAGPLAGVLAGMIWAKNNIPEATHVLSSAADTPFFPKDLNAKFMVALNQSNASHAPSSICLARSGDHRHPVFGLWPISLADDLERFLVDDDIRKVMAFVKRYHLIEVEFEITQNNGVPFDPFFNINTREDLIEAEKLLDL